MIEQITLEDPKTYQYKPNQQTYEEINHSPHINFLKILTSNEDVRFAFTNKLGENIIVITFNQDKIRHEFIFKYFFFYFTALFIAINFILLFIEFSLRKPIIHHFIYSPKLKGVSKFFATVKTIIELKGFNNSYSDDVTNLKKNILLTTNNLVENISNILSKKLDIILEDAQDTIKSLRHHSQDYDIKIFEGIYDVSISNYNEVQEIVKVISEINNLFIEEDTILLQTKLDIIDLLIQNGINHNEIKMNNFKQSARNFLSNDFFVTTISKKKINALLASLTSYARTCGDILSVNISKENYLLDKQDYQGKEYRLRVEEFTIDYFIELKNISTNLNNMLMRCRTFAMCINGIINIQYIDNKMILKLIIPIENN